MNSINKELADEWGLRLMHVYGVNPRTWQPWIYEPNQRPRQGTAGGQRANPRRLRKSG